jgi:hypothetical protein
VGDEPAGDRRGEQGVPVCHDSYRLDEVLGPGALEQEPACSGTQRVVDVLVLLERGQDDHSCLVRGAWIAGGRGDAGRSLEPVHAGHADVHQHDVEPQPLGLGDGLRPVGGVAHHGDARLAAEHEAQARADQVFVVGDQDPDRFGHGLSPVRGSQAVTCQPPAGAGPAWTSPPNSAARSHIPAIPRLIDQAAEARQAGLELRETVLVIFGSPQAGTPVMAAPRHLPAATPERDARQYPRRP